MIGSRSEDSTRPITSRWITIEPFLLLSCAALAPLTILIIPKYIENRVAKEYNFTLVDDDSTDNTCQDRNTTSNPDYKIRQNIANETAFWIMISTAVTHIPAIFVAPFYGALSDRLSRKLNLFLPLIASVLTVILQLVVMYCDLPIVIFALANVFLGIGGGYCYFTAGCYAYIADITDGKSRVFRMSIVSAIAKLGIALMPLIFGYVIDLFGIIPAMWTMLTTHIVCILYLFVPGLLPETVKQKPTISTNGRKTDLVSNTIYDIHKVLKENTQKRQVRLLLLLVLLLLTDLVQLTAGAAQVFTIYGLGPPFCWSVVTLGYFNFAYFGSASLGEIEKMTFPLFLHLLPSIIL